MTIPIERIWAVEGAREFLGRLADPKETQRIPYKIRREARFLRKHFPHPKLDFANIWSGKEWGEVKELIDKIRLCSDRRFYE